MIDAIIDKLTESVEELRTGRRYVTLITRVMSPNEFKLASKWLFNWQSELPQREVYRLTIPAISDTPQGLISLERQVGFVFVHLVESHPQNVGKQKRFVGIAGNLIAYAAMISRDLGFAGVVAFDAKTELIRHYETTLGAQLIGRQRMALDPVAASHLIQRYFGEHHGTNS